MTTAKEVFRKHALLKANKPSEEDIDEAIAYSEFSFIWDAMNEFAKLYHEEQIKLEDGKL